MKKENQKYKICMLSSAHSAFDDRIFYREAKTLVKAGYKVYLIISHDKDEIIESIQMVSLSKRKSRIYRFFIKNWIILFKAIKINAIVHHFHDPDLIPIALLLKLIGKKVVYDVHENVSLQILSAESIFLPIRKILSIIIKFIESIALNYSYKIIIAGKDIQYQSHFRKFSHKIILIRNYPVIIIPRIKVFPKPKGKIKFVYTGSINSDRSIMEIIKAFKQINRNNAELLLLGNLENINFKKIILNEIDGCDNIKYIPSVSYEKMFDMLMNYHVGLICYQPTLNNINALSGRNNKIYEYMQAGLAVIGSNFKSWKDFIYRNNIGVTVDPCNISEIGKAMRFFIENRQELKIMGENAKKTSIKYSWESERCKLIDLYKELCN